MAEQSSSLSRSRKLSDQQRLFTFFVQDMMFGLDVKHVLMLDQNIDKIQTVPVEEKGLCGVIRFQGVVVPVLDFAHRIGVPSGLDIKRDLINSLLEKEREHIAWVEKLAEAIEHDQSFHLDVESSECPMSLWLRQFESRDETVTELIRGFVNPHNDLHAAGAKALRQVHGQDPVKIAQYFKQEASEPLKQIHTLFRRVKEQLESDMRQVLLFVTDDGKTPLYALKIDEINDVMTYDLSDFQASSSGALSQIQGMDALLSGIYSADSVMDCLVLDVSTMTDTQAAAS